MKYFLQRDGRTYGPYSYDDLKRYQAENRIGPNDLIRREDSQQWEPWQQVLNPTVQPSADPTPPQVTPPAQPAPASFGVPTPAPQQPGGFGGNPPAFGGGQQGGFGNTPPAFGGAGFGQPPAQQQPGFGQQPPAEQGFGGAPQGGFGASGGGFGSQGGFGGGFGQQPQGSEVPGAFGAYGAQGGFGAGQPMHQPQGYGGAVGPMPPDMQWWMVLIIGMVSCGLFLIYWIYKQAQFVKQLDPQTPAPKLYLFALILYVSGYCVAIVGAIAAAAMGSDVAIILPMLGQLVILGGAVCLIMAAFKMRASIHNYYTMVEPMGINLMDTTGAVLTFFFSVYYFQYHFANIAARKKAMGHQ